MNLKNFIKFVRKNTSWLQVNSYGVQARLLNNHTKLNWRHILNTRKTSYWVHAGALSAATCLYLNYECSTSENNHVNDDHSEIETNTYSLDHINHSINSEKAKVLRLWQSRQAKSTVTQILNDYIYNNQNSIQHKKICQRLNIQTLHDLQYPSGKDLQIEISETSPNGGYKIICPMYETTSETDKPVAHLKIRMISQVNNNTLDKHGCLSVELTTQIENSFPDENPIVLYFNKNLNIASRINQMYSQHGLINLRDEIIKQFDLNHKFVMHVSKFVNRKYTIDINSHGENELLIEMPLFDVNKKNSIQLSKKKLLFHLKKDRGANNDFGSLLVCLETEDYDTERLEQLCTFENWNGQRMYKPLQKAQQRGSQLQAKASTISAIYDILYSLESHY